MKRILVVQTAFLGDLVLSTPVYDALGELYPDAELELLTTGAGKLLFASDPRFSAVTALEKRGHSFGVRSFLEVRKHLRLSKFDAAFSLHRSFRTSLLLSSSRIPRRVGFQDAVGASLYSEQVKRKSEGHAVERLLSLLEEDWNRSGLAMEALYNRPLRLVRESSGSEFAGCIVLVPGSAWKTKQWHWSNYRLLATELVRSGSQVVVTGTAEERELCHLVADGLDGVINLAGELSLPQFVGVIFGAAGLVCNDSFALHVSSAAQIPTVAVFCATSPSFGFGPWKNPFAVVVEKSGLWCKPCRRHGGKQCPTGTEHCMRGVSAREVYMALAESLSKARGFSPSQMQLSSEMKLPLSASSRGGSSGERPTSESAAGTKEIALP
ncbi:MAG: glycosyltransferase family 9 protein [Bdellovibrionales bacterium]|nr:glycosyltransferase family 9 protein [Bdellovibrionales bacterium]